VVATAGVVTPLLASASASAESAVSAPAPVVRVDLTAPATVTRGAAAELLVRVVAASSAALPGRTVQFVSRPAGAASWSILGSATTGADGSTTFPVRSVDEATDYGAYYTDASGTVRSQTASTVIHVIDLAASAPQTVAYNHRATVSGNLVQDGMQGVAGEPVQVRFRTSPRSAWSTTRWTTTDTSGAATLTTRLTHTVQVGLRFPGSATLAPSPERVVTIHVAPKPALAPSGFRFPFLDPSAASAPGSWTLDQGVDLAASGYACGAAAKLVAVGDGTVVQTGISGFGPTAPVIRMSDGPFAGRNVYYGHTGKIYVHVGQVVHAGDLVAQIGCGSVGYSSAPHLEIGVGVPGGPPCCPAFGQTSRSMLKQLLASYRRS
jgi:murein DD-endopeptidase MepM/ murein hydrolase activator NlpD